MNKFEKYFGCSVITLVALVLLLVTLKPAGQLLIHPPIPWSDGTVVESPDDLHWSSFVFAAQLVGTHESVPDRVVLFSQSELDDPYSEIDVKVGQGKRRVPKAALSFQLDPEQLQDRVARFNEEYSTASKDYRKSVLYLEQIEDHDGQPTFVMARLTDREAFRYVWSVRADGVPVPLTFAYANDRQGYRYKDSITRENALEDRLLLP